MSATCYVSLQEYVVVFRKSKDLKPHPWNIKIYGNEPVDQELVRSIEESGLKEHLVIKPNGILISGHRRLKALKELGYTTVPCIIRTYDSELEERKDLLAYNKQREKSYSQRMAEADEYEAIIAEENELKRLSTLKQFQHNNNNRSSQLRLTANDNGSSTDSVTKEIKPSAIKNQTDSRTAEAVGLSRSTYNRLKQVHEATKAGNQVALKLMAKVDNEEMSVSGVEKIFKAPPKLAEKAIEKIEANPRISPERAIQEARIELKKEEIKIQEPVKLPKGLYNVILSDPPYSYDFSESRRCDIEVHYPTMSLDEIKSIKVPASDNCVLFLWSPAPKLEQALEVINAWGFEYKTCAVWDKMRPGLGFWWRNHHELLLVGTKGNPRVPDPENRFASVIREKRIVHSKKPDCVREMIERMFPNGKYLELFAREKRDRWECWGNQV